MKKREELLEKMKKIEQEIKVLEKQKMELVKGLEEISISEWRKKKEEGWEPFVFYSSYYGSECGIEGTKIFYAFSPNSKFDAAKWTKAKFSHGDRTMEETNREFENFLDSLQYDQYDIVDDYVIQAVWPELYQDWKRL